MWVDNTGIPITTSIPKDIRRRRQERYLSDRDGYRAKRGASPVWAGTRGAFAAAQYELTKVHRGELARRVRVIWDKGWHGGNIAKEEGTRNVCYVAVRMGRDTGWLNVVMLHVVN